ncbi:hypothetical protein ACOY59_04115, partial [Enterobacter roggenkampii]|uniref:hypothetical protein n=1 Tax=Enterobacter roggenkampii TaxID=1812935 RepID=UPI003BE18ECB
MLSSEHAKTGRLHLFFVTFPAGIIVAAEKYQPFVLVLTPGAKEGANKQVISSQADSLIKISRIWADF